MEATHPAPIIQMLIPSLQLFAALAQQSETSLSANAPPICIHRLLFSLLLGPTLPSTIGFRAVRAQTPVGELAHQRAAVIALVGDHFARPIRADLVHNSIAVGIRHHTCNTLACFGYRLGNRCGVSNV